MIRGKEETGTGRASTSQQSQTLSYFRRHSRDWRKKAENTGTTRVNVIGQRNGFVLTVAGERRRTRTCLDIGCGTGELACDLARRGVDVTGIDYAPEMIRLAVRKAEDQDGVKPKFVCQSVFDFRMKAGGYDLISANGFIEYISLPQLQSFLRIVARALAPGGSFVVGSRNRLFNILSLNEYTLSEIRSGTAELLLRESLRWASAVTVDRLGKGPCAPLQAPGTVHARTGVKVTTRFQYTPQQLIRLLRDRSLHTVEVYPVHIHGVPPALKATQPELHTSISIELQTLARRDARWLSHASSFMIHARRDR